MSQEAASMYCQQEGEMLHLYSQDYTTSVEHMREVERVKSRVRSHTLALTSTGGRRSNLSVGAETSNASIGDHVQLDVRHACTRLLQAEEVTRRGTERNTRKKWEPLRAGHDE